MKKFIFIFGMVALLAACKGTTTTEEVPVNDSIIMNDSVVLSTGDITTLGIDTTFVDSLI